VPPARVLVVVPTYNERENIEELLRQVGAAAPAADVLIVDDGSPDGTAALVRSLELPRVRVLERSEKSGLGSAYRTAFRQAIVEGYDAVVEMDADLSHDPSALPAMLAAAGGDPCLVIGSRYVTTGAITDWSVGRRAISKFGCWYARTLLALPVMDATSGYRIYRRGVIQAIDLDAVRAEGYAFQIEMTYRAHQAGAVILEVPIEFRDRTRGTSKMSPRIAFEAFRLVTTWAVKDRVLHRARAADQAGDHLSV